MGLLFNKKEEGGKKKGKKEEINLEIFENRFLGTRRYKTVLGQAR